MFWIFQSTHIAASWMFCQVKAGLSTPSSSSLRCVQTLWYLLNPSPCRNEELNYLAEELSGVPHVPCCRRSRSAIQTLTMYQQTNRPRRAASCKGVNGILRNTKFGKGSLNTHRTLILIAQCTTNFSYINLV